MRPSWCAIGVERPKTPINVGTLWRSAVAMGAAYVFVVGPRYPGLRNVIQSSDTTKCWRHMPLFKFETLEDMLACRPHSARLVGIELHEHSQSLPSFVHPAQAVYLLGVEDHGLTAAALKACDSLVQIPGRYCLNVAAAGSVVLYDRLAKLQRDEPEDAA